jgi:thymidine kinase
MCDAVSLTTLEEAQTYLNEKKYDVLIIDEAQFFKDLYTNVTQWADNLQMQIVVCGLDGDSERRPFGDILRLIPHAEEVERLTAFCSMCRDGTPATFTKYLDNRKKEENEVAIGSGEVYTPVCRFHYLENK